MITSTDIIRVFGCSLGTSQKHHIGNVNLEHGKAREAALFFVVNKALGAIGVAGGWRAASQGR